MGKFGSKASDAAVMAIDFVATNMERLRAWVQGSSSSYIPGHLFRQSEDLMVAAQGYDTSKDGGTTVMALSVIVMLGGLTKLNADVAISGDVDLTGTLYPVLDIEEMIRSAKDGSVGMVIFCPKVYNLCVMKDFENLPPDLRDYARTALRPTKTMVDVLELTVPGE